MGIAAKVFCLTQVLWIEVAAAQTGAIIIPDNPKCTNCRVVVQRLATLGGLNTIVGNTAYLPGDGLGRYYVAVPEDPGHITVLDRQGKVQRTLGSRGRGPGEFIGIIRPFFTRNALLYAFDNTALRTTVFDTMGRRVREFNVPRGIERVAIFGDGSFVANGDFRTPSSIGFPLHYLASDGRVLRSFGAAKPMQAPGLITNQVKRIAAVDDSLFWSVAESEYVLELWNARAGAMVTRFKRAAEWFPKDAGRNDITPRQPPRPFVQALSIDAQGRLWVLILTVDPTWRTHIKPKKQLPGEPISYRADYPGVYDAVIEVIDPVRRELVASQRFDQFLRGFARADQVFGFREDNAGTPLLDVWSISLDTVRRKQ